MASWPFIIFKGPLKLFYFNLLKKTYLLVSNLYFSDNAFKIYRPDKAQIWVLKFYVKSGNKCCFCAFFKKVRTAKSFFSFLAT